MVSGDTSPTRRTTRHLLRGCAPAPGWAKYGAACAAAISRSVGRRGVVLPRMLEGVGLWLLKRWGEYFAVVATSIFLPLEVHDLAKGITTTRVVTFSINVAAVVYLLISKRLFGVRGGRKAYDVERRGEQLLDLERAAMLT